MGSQKRKLAKILGVYIDDEAEVVKAIESAYEEGLPILVKIGEFNLFKGLGISLFDFIKENFYIVSSSGNSQLRKFLNKPYLFLDEEYLFTFKSFDGKNSLSINMDFSKMNEQTMESLDLKINKQHNLIQGIITDNKFYLEVKRIKQGKYKDLVLVQEKLLNSEDYAAELKKNILDTFLMTKSWEHVVKRSTLWTEEEVSHENWEFFRKNIKPQDFGIKDLIHLRELFIHFRFNVTNEELFEIDDSAMAYQKNLSSLLKDLENRSLTLKIDSK